jgi:hypothetical protein
MLTLEPPKVNAKTRYTDERIARAFEIVEKSPYKVYFDQRDRLTNDMIRRYWSEKNETAPPSILDPMWWIAQEVDEWFFAGSETDGKPDWVRNLLEEEGYEKKEIDELIYDHQIECYCLLEYDTEHFNTDVNVRFPLYSNYDCQLSHWTSDGTYTFGETYFGDMCKALCLDPRAVLSPTLNVIIPENEGWKAENAAVNGKKLASELVNNTCPSLLTILAEIPFGNLADRKFVLPKGCKVGMFSSFVGGGSMFSCELIRDLEIDLDTPIDGDQYCHWGMVPDCFNKYSIVDTFGQWIG